ncbi:MAG TPA: hypothetical protein PK513_06240, partial [Alphaproteobacteria bacterium]|nr:hypothetical protein [Alphaproteobacteria bacterium]
MRKPQKIQRSIFVFALALLMLVAFDARAEDVRARTGTHAQYSRLVFDWDSHVEYSIDRAQNDRLLISFGRGAALDISFAKANPVANIESVDIISSDPLKVALSISADSRIRDLRAGNKVVIDIYNPPGAPPAEKPAPKIAEKHPATEKKTEHKTAHTEPVEENHGKEKYKAPDQQQLHAATDAQDQERTQEGGEEQKTTRKLKMREQPTLITVSSTQNFGMAAFEREGKLWLIGDKSNLLMKPQLSGPHVDQFSNIEEIEIENGKAFVMPAPKTHKMSGEGGGILWRIKISPDLPTEEITSPIRVDVKRDEARSGKLLWPLKGARAVLELEDPLTGRAIKVVTVDDAEQYTGPVREFVDFDVLHALFGLAIMPKVEDLELQIVRGGVEISRPEGVTMVEDSLLASMTSRKIKRPDDKNTQTDMRVFDFKAWQLGGVNSMLENKRIILGGLNDQPENARGENLLTLAKMYLSNAMSAEALGVLDFALLERPGLSESPQYKALLGAASALSSHNEAAYAHLSIEALKPFEEIQYWRAYVFADVGDWQQAADIFPQNVGALYDYPVLLQNRLVPQLAEIALRAGDLPRAQELLHMIDNNKKSMMPPQAAALAYLQGEAARQHHDIEKTKKLWEPLATGADDLYRAKAGLALTRLKVNEGEITTKEAIDNLERLRYAWRGDQLEVQINYWLGRTYFEDGQYLKGLKIMRDAVSYDVGTPLGQRVAAEMADMFSDLFMGDDLDKVSPMDSIALYDEFKELVPLDERGNQIIERLAEHLASADLLTRAGDLLQYQLDHRLQGADIYRIGVRLAAIRLLDNMPDKALAALNIAAAKLEELPEEMRTPRRYHDISLLRARALSRKGRPDQALAL